MKKKKGKKEEEEEQRKVAHILALCWLLLFGLFSFVDPNLFLAFVILFKDSGSFKAHR
jgi:hypothetical protein